MAGKFYTDAAEPSEGHVRRDGNDLHLSIEHLTPYQKMLMLALIDLNQGIQGLAEVLAEGKFQDLHWIMFQRKFAFTVDQMECMRKLYPDSKG